VRGEGDNDTLAGGLGDDALYGGDKTDTLSGGAGEDILYGEAATDYVYGGDDEDEVYGGVGADRLFGGDGIDLMEGGSQDDTVMGGDGGDVLAGGADDDLLGGGLDLDIIEGGTGNDLLDGNSGDDLLEGGAGNDDLYGGADIDTAVFSGPISGYSFGVDGADLIVTDVDPGDGDDGTDILNGIEFLRFAGRDYEIDEFGVPDGDRATLLPDSTNGGELWNGDGNTITNFIIASNEDAGVEIALKAKIRQGPDLVPQGIVYDAPTGPQSTEWGSQVDNPNRAAWSFDFSVNADTDNDGVSPEFRIKIDLDVDTGAGTNFKTAFFGSIRDALEFSSGTPNNANADFSVIDNSKNLVFDEFTELFEPGAPYSMNDPGEYNIRLTVFDADHLLATTEIVVNVTGDFVV
jgi:hypothetical protein